MSSKIIRPPYIIHDNNPEKKVPEELTEQFFQTIKGADINEIRDFVIKNKIKFSSMVEKKTNKTPFHVVLELDEKVANSYTKLELLKYLSSNGAPTDSPDNSNIRPIHLAAQLQDPDIIDFMIDKLNSDPSNTDSSNNSALHYAVRGTEIACPSVRSATPGSLSLPQKIEKEELSVGYKVAVKNIIKLLSTKTAGSTGAVVTTGPTIQSIHENLIHIINTVMKIPQIYKNSEEEKKIQTRLVEIFTDIGMNRNYSGDLTKQQSDIENLIKITTETVENDTLYEVNTPLVIEANSPGWGPILPVESPLTKILPNNRSDQLIILQENLDKKKQDIISKQEITGINDYLSKTTTVLYKYIEALIFGDTAIQMKNKLGVQQKKIISVKKYGSNVTNKKMFFLLMYRYIVDNHKSIFVDRIMDNFNFMANRSQYQVYLTLDPTINTVIPIDPTGNYIYNSNLGYLFNRFKTTGKHDIFENDFIKITDRNDPEYIQMPVNSFFAKWLTTENINDNKYFNQKLINLQNTAQELNNEDFNLKNEITKLQSQKLIKSTSTDSWLIMFGNIIKKIQSNMSIVSFGDQVIGNLMLQIKSDYTDITNNNFPLGSLGKSRKPKYTYIDIFRIFDQFRQVLNNITVDSTGIAEGKYDDYHYPYVFNTLPSRPDTRSDNGAPILGPGYGDPVHINTWIKNVDNFYTDFQKNIFPELLFCEKMFYRVTQLEIKKLLEFRYDILRTEIKISTKLSAKNIEMKLNYFNQDDMYTLILPYYTQKNIPEMIKVKNNKFTDLNIFKTTDKYYTELMKDPLNKNIKNEIINCVSCFFNSNNAFFNDTTTNALRIGLEKIKTNILCANNCKLTMDVIEKYDYVNNLLSKNIKQMYKTFINDRTINFERQSVSNPVSPLSTGVILDYISKLSTDGDKLSYITEITVYYFTYVLRKFNSLSEYIDVIHIIINDIIHHIELGYEYFVPQVLLPALLRQVLIIINKFRKIKKYVDDHITKSTQIITKIDFADNNQKDVMELSDKFNKTVILSLEMAYVKILGIISYHNNIIDYLHQISATKLINNINDSIGQTISKVFAGNLSKISSFPEKMTDIFDTNNVQKILDEYQIDDVKYFFGKDVSAYYSLLGKDIIVYDNPYDYYGPQPYNPPTKNRIAVYYRNIMDLHRDCTKKITINSIEKDPLRIPQWEQQLIKFLRTKNADIKLIDTLPIALKKYGKNLNTAVNDWILEDLPKWENDLKKYMFGKNNTLNMASGLLIMILAYAGPTATEASIVDEWKKSVNSTYKPKPQLRPNVDIGPPVVDNWQMVVWCKYLAVQDKCRGYVDYNNSKFFSGKWLTINSNEINFCDASIQFIGDDYTFNLVAGISIADKSLLNNHLVIQKQHIVEDIIQYVIDNRSKDEIATEIYDKLLILANETTYDKIDSNDINDMFHVKAYILIGKIVDNAIIEIIKYATKQSIHNWIYSEIKKTYPKISDTDTINKINQQLYSKISPGDVEKNIIKSIYKLNKAPDYTFSKIKIPQMEPDVNSLNYFPDQVKPPKTPDNKLVSYLYNINYFSSGIGTKPICYNIDTYIAEKLITSKNINLQNSDGQTALHFAVQMHHPDLVDILIERGAIPSSFKNNSQQTPIELSKQELLHHLELIPMNPGGKISNFVGKFATPFNELLIARLSDEKYNNNIIRNIKFAIPISLCIYQQMFFTYLQNYKFGISPDLKNKMNNIFRKYNMISKTKIIYEYPIDLFEISHQNEMNRIIEYANIKNQSKKIVNKANSKKIKAKKDLITELDFQIDGLNKEKQNSVSDQNKINVIDMALNKLTKLKKTYELDIKNKLEFKIKPDTNTTVYDQYIIAVDGIKKSIDDRSRSITQFYDELFQNRISSTNNELHFGIWLNYMDKPLTETPSMIFLLINKILELICKNNNLSADTLSDLNAIEEFMQVVRSYIDRREDLPNNLDDNPVNDEDKDQIVFLINLILTPAVYNIILGQIDKSLSEMDASENLYKTTGDKEAVMKEITETKFGTYTIETYIKNKLPTLAFKYYSQTFQNGQDPDKKILQDSQLFAPIISIIKSNTIIIIDDDSTLITNFNNYLIPFMLNTYQNFIHHIRLAIFGFEKYLLNTYQLVKIYSAMMKKK